MRAGGLNLAFAGTPDIAVVVLNSLLENSRHTIDHVYTQPDRRKGRGRKTNQGPVKSIAQEYAIPVKQPATSAELARDADLRAIDALVVVAYGLILPAPVLSQPRYGCINVHLSMLPRWRGAAPVQRAIQAGDEQTGVSVMLMDEGIDTGGVLLQRSCVVNDDDTGASLAERLAKSGSECLLRVLADLTTGSVTPVKQDETRATYAGKITKQEAEIDWNTEAAQIERNVRAFNPAPVAFASLNNVKIRVWDAHTLETDGADNRPGEIISYTPQGLDISTGNQALRILALQREGKKKQSIRDFYNGYPNLF